MGVTVQFTEMKYDEEGGPFSAGAAMQVYTNMMKRTHEGIEIELLNILHIHFNEDIDSISFDLVYLEEG